MQGWMKWAIALLIGFGIIVVGFRFWGPLLSIFFGILILIFPRFLNYLVAIYLILAGLVGFGVIVFK